MVLTTIYALGALARKVPVPRVGDKLQFDSVYVRRLGPYDSQELA